MSSGLTPQQLADHVEAVIADGLMATRSWAIDTRGTCDGCSEDKPLCMAYEFAVLDEHSEPWLCVECVELQPDRVALKVIALVRGAIADAIEASMGSVALARGLNQVALVTAYRSGLHDASLIARRAALTT
jgi:hypothetical protein